MNQFLFSTRSVSKNDEKWMVQKITETWGAEFVIAHGTIFYPSKLPGFIAEIPDEAIGLVTYNIEGDACEIVTLKSWIEKHGIGTSLVKAVKGMAIQQSCKKIWLVTTNDNTQALRFFQKLGFTIATIRINEISQARLLKPQIPIFGLDGIPIRDEIELEMSL